MSDALIITISIITSAPILLIGIISSARSTHYAPKRIIADRVLRCYDPFQFTCRNKLFNIRSKRIHHDNVCSIYELYINDKVVTKIYIINHLFHRYIKIDYMTSNPSEIRELLKAADDKLIAQLLEKTHVDSNESSFFK